MEAISDARKTAIFARSVSSCLRSLAIASALAIVAPASMAEEEMEFDEAHVFFELNDTDGDLGIHALIDGEPWKRLEIADPNERRMLLISVNGRLRRQGLTEVFFESAEPPFDELSPQMFFRRFPAGEYEIEGRTLDGEELESIAELTHVMPAPPQPTVNGNGLAEECDPEEPGYDAPLVVGPVTIAWPPVTMSHPDPEGGGAGVQPPVLVTVHNYEVVVEADVEVNGEELTAVTSTVLPPDQTSYTIPAEFLSLSDQFKYEILVREDSFNQTAIENCFQM